MLNQFLVAGNETTTKLIASSVRLLLAEPERMEALRAAPAAIAGFVEEALRLEPPVQGLYRTAVVDTEVGGVPIAAGEHLLLVYAAGNRDPARFEEPGCLDPDRPNLMTHLAFGTGEHFCLGARWPGPRAASPSRSCSTGWRTCGPTTASTWTGSTTSRATSCTASAGSRWPSPPEPDDRDDHAPHGGGR